MLQNVLSISGNSFNNGSFFNSITVNGVLCPAINISFTKVYCLVPSVMTPNVTYNISVAIFNALSTLSTSTVFSLPISASASPPPVDLPTASSLTITIVGASIMSFACLALIAFGIYKLRRKQDIKDLTISEARETKWTQIQMTNMTFIPKLTTLYAENKGLNLPGFMRYTWNCIRLLVLLGKGASAAIYSADVVQQSLKQKYDITSTVAVKVFCGAVHQPDLRQEAAILSKLTHCPVRSLAAHY